MSSQGTTKRDADSLRVGQRFQRNDGAGLVFEVVELVAGFGRPHLRLRRIDDPTDTRVFAHSALMDRHLFRAIDASAPARQRGYAHLRLSPT